MTSSKKQTPKFNVGDKVKVINRSQTYVIKRVGDIWDLEGYVFIIAPEGSDQVLEEFFLEKHLTKVS